MDNASRVLIVESDLIALNFLRDMFNRAGYSALTAPSGKEGLIEAWRDRPEMIVIDPALPDLDGLEVVRKLRADHRTASAKILLISARAQPEDILTGMQSGADEYLIKRPGADLELLERVQALFPLGGEAADEAASQSAARGRLICFLSAKGGLGTSSLCANIAHVLAKQVNPKTVVVVDLVLPIGSISQIVGVNPLETIVEATQLEPKAVTPEKMLALARVMPNWQFHLLAGARDPEAAQLLQVTRLEAVFETLRQTFDYVLVDLGRALSRISLPLIRTSARLVLILGSDTSTVALTKITLKYLELQGVRRSHIFPILNRAVGLEGMTKPDMEKELALTIPGIIPHLGGSFALANNQHQPFAFKFPTNTATFALHDLSVGLLNQVEEAVSPPAAD